MTNLNKRITDLEGQRRPNTGHDYTAVIPFGEPVGDQGAKYYRDGVEISRERYQAEAPRDQRHEVIFGDPIPPREAPGSPKSDF